MTEDHNTNSGSPLDQSPLSSLGYGPAEGTTLIGGEDRSGNAERRVAAPKSADAHGWWWGTGRRKTAVARCRMRPAKGGSAGVKIQKTRKLFKSVEDYFTEERDRNDAYAPLKLTGTFDKMEVIIRVGGGGTMGQAQAIRLAVARALVGYDPNFDRALRDAGFLSRDARKVERKKYGLAGARRRFQFSKR